MKQLLLLIGLSLILACAGEEINFTTDDDYIIFGHFYGECQGDGCIQNFLLRDGKLYEDSTDPYAGGPKDHEWNWTELSTELYQQVKDLPDYIPPKLLTKDSQSFGMPDAGDWGGAYLELSSGENRKRWVLDQSKRNMEDFLHEIVDKINERIAIINH